MQMRHDDEARAESKNIANARRGQFNEIETQLAIGRFITKGSMWRLCQTVNAELGGFSLSCRMEFFQDGGSALIRFPITGMSIFPDEKVRNDVAVIRYLQEHTSIHVPFVIQWGYWEESPSDVVPFIIIDYIEHRMNLGDALNMPCFGKECHPAVDSDIDPNKLEMLIPSNCRHCCTITGTVVL